MHRDAGTYALVGIYCACAILCVLYYVFSHWSILQ
jgi:hypothetical protein